MVTAAVFPREVIGGREKLGSNIFWQQRLITGFDTDKNTFIADRFLQEPTASVQRENALGCLIGMQRGMVDYNSFFDEIPRVSIPQDSKTAGEGRVMVEKEVVAALNSLIGHGTKAPISAQDWEGLVGEFGTQGRDIVKMAGAMVEKNPKISFPTFDKALKLIHGDLRAEAYLGVAELDRIAHQPAQAWEAALEKLTSSPAGSAGDKDRLLLQLGRDEVLRQKLPNADYYTLLGVQPNATAGEIKKAYHEKMMENHPDLHKGAVVEERSKRLNKANATLSDKEKRKQYDAMLAAQRNQQGADVGHDQQNQAAYTQPNEGTRTGQKAGPEVFSALGIMSGRIMPIDWVVSTTDGRWHYQGPARNRPIQGSVLNPKNPQEAETILQLLYHTDADIFRAIAANLQKKDPSLHQYLASRFDLSRPDSQVEASGPQAQAAAGQAYTEQPPIPPVQEYSTRQAPPPPPPAEPRAAAEKPRQRPQRPVNLERPDASGHLACVSEEAWQDSQFGFAQNIGSGKYDHQEDSYEAKREGAVVMLGVNDGAGGHEGSAVASMTVADSLFGQTCSDDGISSGLRGAHNRIAERGYSTATVALIDGQRRLKAFNCGDSRIIVVRGGQIVFYTQDHSLVNQLLRSGSITPAEARTHPQRNVITASIGGDYRVDDYNFQLAQNDVVLAVTDGIIDPLQNEGIAAVVSQYSRMTPQNIAQGLVNAAYQAYPQGGDNLTCVCYRV